MARTALTPVSLSQTGTDLAAAAVTAELTDGNSYPWAQGRMLYIVNADDSSLTVTIPTPGTIGLASLAIADLTITVPAGEARLCKPLGPEVMQTTGLVHINYAGADTAVSVAVLDV